MAIGIPPRPPTYGNWDVERWDHHVDYVLTRQKSDLERYLEDPDTWFIDNQPTVVEINLGATIVDRLWGPDAAREWREAVAAADEAARKANGNL